MWLLKATGLRFSVSGKVAAGDYLEKHEDTFEAWNKDNYMHYSGVWLKYYLGFFWASIYLTVSFALFTLAVVLMKP